MCSPLKAWIAFRFVCTLFCGRLTTRHNDAFAYYCAEMIRSLSRCFVGKPWLGFVMGVGIAPFSPEKKGMRVLMGPAAPLYFHGAKTELVLCRWRPSRKGHKE